MRMRKKKHADERIQACAEYLRWNDMCENKKTVCLEIGCGKGDFICEMALKFPDVNFIAVEKSTDVIIVALEKAKNMRLSNVRFVISDIKEFVKYLEADKISKISKISKIYLNFSDPWHKNYQRNQRLTHSSFLDLYKKFLKAEAEIIMKTDNKTLFDFSVRSLKENGFDIKHKTYDLYQSEFIEGNIQTEYEKKFVEQNILICYLKAVLKSS